MKTNNYNYNFAHYLSYFRANFKISLIDRFEYKINLYSALFMAIFYYIAILTFGSIIINIIGNEINWTYIDFLLLTCISTIIHFTSGMFLYGKELKKKILCGYFNKLLCKPGNPFLNHILDFSPNYIILIPLLLIIFVPFFYTYSSITLYSLVISLPIFLILILLAVSIHQLIISISFYFLNLGDDLANFYDANFSVAYQYPGQIFENSNIKLVLVLFYGYFISIILVPLIQNKVVRNLWINIGTILFITILCISLTLLNWHFGLKRYEGYN